MPKFLIVIFFSFILFLHSTTLLSQDKRDVGLQVGTTYYYGDFNETMPLYQPSFSLGVLFRYNINNYYAIRASALYGSLKGSIPTDMYLIPSSSSSFSTTVIESEIMGEFNFLSFNPASERRAKFSPYVNIGIGIAQVSGMFIPHIPMGVGLKFTPGQRHTFSLEWRLHKTFTDKIDNYISPNDGKSVLLHNNDWFSFFGLTYTYRLYNNSNICPAYK